MFNDAERIQPGFIKGEETEATAVASAFLSRRTMLGTLGAGALAAATLTLPAFPAWGREVSDVDILNFALNLEYLEAEFYTYAITGKSIEEVGIATGGKGTPGPTTGGRKADLTDPIVMAVARELAYDEQQHVLFLRSVLGKNAIAKPALNLMGMGIGFANDAEYLTVGRAMEDTGTSAYTGASTLIKSKVILGAAARILSDEAYHMGNVRLLIAQKGVRVPALDNQDVLPPPAGRRFFAVDQYGLGLTRTMPEVTAIVRPFFPNGMNVALG